MNLKEWNILVLEVLHDRGVDLYKQPLSELRTHRSEMAKVKTEVENILNDSKLSFDSLDTISPSELSNIRAKVRMELAKGNINKKGILSKKVRALFAYFFSEKSVTNKRWIPLEQAVGYIETISSRIFQPLNAMIDADIQDKDLRIEIVNILKWYNQGKSIDDVYEQIWLLLLAWKVDSSKVDVYLENWFILFVTINTQLQKLYDEHVEHMNMTGYMRDLVQKEKKHPLLQEALWADVIDKKPSSLDQDIHTQSADINRSIIEIVSNAADSVPGKVMNVNIETSKTGYRATDSWDGMNPYIILEKLLIPKVSGKTGEITTGRFGVGFYTVLSHLKKSSDFVKVTTRYKDKTYVIEFALHERTGDVFMHTHIGQDTKKSGTIVEVSASDFDQKNAEKLVRETFVSDRGNIFLNGRLLDTDKSLLTLTGEYMSLSFSSLLWIKSHVTIAMNDVAIETIDIPGIHVPSEIVLHFPLSCKLPESRSELAIDAEARKCIKDMISTIVVSSVTRDQKIALFNALAPVLRTFQGRSSGHSQHDNLLKFAHDEFVMVVGTNFKTALPNSPEFQEIATENMVYIDPAIYSVPYDRVPWIEACDDWNWIPLFLVPLHSHAKNRVFKHENTIFLDKAIYEKNKLVPSILNAYFSHLDHSYILIEEKKIGKFEGKKALSDVFLAQNHSGQSFQDMSVSSDTIKGDDSLFAILWEENTERYLSWLDWAQKYFAQMNPYVKELNVPLMQDFCHLNSVERKDTMKQNLVEKIQKKIRDARECMQETVAYYEMIAKYPERDEHRTYIFHPAYADLNDSQEGVFLWIWSQILDLIPVVQIYGLAYQEVDSMVEYIQNLIHEQNICGNELMFNGMHKDIIHENIRKGHNTIEYNIPWNWQIVIADFFDTVEKNPFFMDIWNRTELTDFESVNFLSRLSKVVDFKELSEFFAVHDDPRVFLSYRKFLWIWMDMIDDNAWKRMDILFRKKLIHLPQNTIDAILLQFLSLLPSKSGKYNQYVFKFLQDEWSYHLIPSEIRSYAVYIMEGTEVLGHIENSLARELWSSAFKIPLSTLVQSKRENAKYFSNFQGSPEDIVNFSLHSQEHTDPTKARREIRHATLHQIVNDRYLWIREALQNSIDAVRHEERANGHAPIVQLDTFLEIGRWANGNTEHYLVVRVQDPAGMNLNEIINYLLVPSESSKRGDVDAIGEKWQGFFTILNNSKEVRIQTSKGDGIIDRIFIRPLKNSNGDLRDFEISFVQEAWDFRGTIIEQVSENDMPEVEAAFCKSSIISYAWLLDANRIELRFWDKILNKSRLKLYDTDIPDLGRFTIFHGRENCVTQNGLFVRNLDNEWLKDIPKKLLPVLLKEGIVVDIPTSIQLIKSRNDIAKKQNILPIMSAYMRQASFQSYLSLFMNGMASFDDLPYDYFQRERNDLSIMDEELHADIESIKHGGAVQYERYSDDTPRLTELLTFISSVSLDDAYVSLNDIRKQFLKDPASFDVTTLPLSLQSRALQAKNDFLLEKENLKKAENTFHAPSIHIRRDFSLPDSIELQTKAGTYYAFRDLAKTILHAIAPSSANVQLYYALENTSAHAHQNGDTIAFNLHTWNEDLREFSRMIENNTPASDAQVRDFLEKVVSTITHEYQHNLEKSGESTHNTTFFVNQRQLIMELLLDQQFDIANIFESIKKKNNGTFIDAWEFIEVIP